MQTNDYIIDLSAENLNHLYFCGDLHGEFSTFFYDVSKLKDSLVVVCGDISFGFNHPSFYEQTFRKHMHKLRNNNIFIVLIRGNHDNPIYFSDLKSKSEELAKGFPNIIVLRDYQVIKTNMGNILGFGGARSIDKVNRIKDFSWWEGEMANPMPKNVQEYLKEEGLNIDYVATHSSPSFCEPTSKSGISSWARYDLSLYEDCDAERKLHSDMFYLLSDKMNMKIKKWLYGHYHVRYNPVKLADYDTIFVGLDMVRPRNRKSEYTNRSTKIATDLYEIKTAEDYERTFEQQ